MDPNDLKSYWQSMPTKSRQAYADRAGLSYYYIDKRVIHRYVTPSIETIERLARASRGRLTTPGLVTWFLAPPAVAIRKARRKA